MRKVKFYFFTLFFVFFAVAQAKAVDIQEVETPSGFKVWLVQSEALPMVSVEVAFRAGSVFDPEGRAGLAAFTAALMNEGAGELDAAAFKQRLEDKGAYFATGAGKLNLSVQLQTLKEHLPATFELLGKALTVPRFEQEDAKRIREAMVASLKRVPENPSAVLARAFKKRLYGDHPYGQPTSGYEESVQGFSAANARYFYNQNITRANMVISVVGDVGADTVSRLVDTHLSALPKGKQRNRVLLPPTDPEPLVQRVDMAIPQSHVKMGHLGISRDDPDYFAAYFMNYILGGGGFNSRLMEQVRVKQGLAYSVGSYFDPLPHRGSFEVAVQTKNVDVQRSIDTIISEITKLKQNGISQAEYEGAMNYLTGSFPLRLDSNRKILGYLTTMQLESLGKDYLDTWVEKMKNVSKEDVERVARRLLHPDELVTVIVGGDNK